MSALPMIEMHGISVKPDREFEEYDFQIFVDEMNRTLYCEPENFVVVTRGKIGVIRVLLDKQFRDEYELLPLIFEGDHMHACHQRKISEHGILIWDNNDRGLELGHEVIKFSIIAKKRGTETILYMDPVVIND